MNNDKWEQLYLQAAMETDGMKVPQRVAAVKEAIQGRLQDLEQSTDHHNEREQMKMTLPRLDSLEADAQRWLEVPNVRPEA
jgi:hypothetical protein